MASGGDFLFTAKADSHKALYDFMSGTSLDELSVRRKEGRKTLILRYRWFTQAPLREPAPAKKGPAMPSTSTGSALPGYSPATHR